jgi:hypothetical protein
MSRVYEPLNMSTAKWQKIPPIVVYVDSLLPSQCFLYSDKLPKGHTYSGDNIIHVVLHSGLLLISDGPHSVEECKARGEKTIEARVLVKLGNKKFTLKELNP